MRAKTKKTETRRKKKLALCSQNETQEMMTISDAGM